MDKKKIVHESLLEYTQYNNESDRETPINLLKTNMGGVVNALKTALTSIVRSDSTILMSNNFNRVIDDLVIRVNDKTIIKGDYFYIDVKIVGNKIGDNTYNIDTDSIGVYYISNNGEEVAEFYDKDELTQTNAFITFNMSFSNG